MSDSPSRWLPGHIEWGEPFVVILFLGHALLLGTVIVSRKHHDVQIVIFLLVAAVLGFAERLNEILGRHWQLVTRSNVFDKSGAFMAFVWGIPLLCIMTLQVCLGILEVVKLMIRVKTEELTRKRE